MLKILVTITAIPSFPEVPVTIAGPFSVIIVLDFHRLFDIETRARQPSAVPRPLSVATSHHRISISSPTGLHEVRDPVQYVTLLEYSAEVVHFSLSRLLNFIPPTSRGKSEK